MVSTIDEYSVAATVLEMFFNDTALSIGTGFFWQNPDEIYLVTNWHNVTGIDPRTSKHLSATNAEPNKIRLDGFVDGDPNKR